MAVGGNNRNDGAEANYAPNLLSGCTSNLRLEEMADICRQGIAIDDYNNTALENVTRQVETTAGTGNWREGLIFPRKSGNLQNYFASFRHYSHDSVLRMSLLQLFFIMVPEDYLDKVLISETRNGVECANGYSRVYKVDCLLAIHGMIGWNLESLGLVVQDVTING